MWTIPYIISQCLVLIALFFLVLSLVAEYKKTILSMRIIQSAFYSSNFIVLGNWVGFGNSGFSLGRAVIFYFFRRYNKKPNIWVLFILLAGQITINIILWNGFLGLLPMAAGLSACYLLWQDNTKVVRIFMPFTSAAWVVFHCLTLNIMGIVMESIAILVGLHSILWYEILKKNSMLKEKTNTPTKEIEIHQEAVFEK